MLPRLKLGAARGVDGNTVPRTPTRGTMQVESVSWRCDALPGVPTLELRHGRLDGSRTVLLDDEVLLTAAVPIGERLDGGSTHDFNARGVKLTDRLAEDADRLLCLGVD